MFAIICDMNDYNYCHMIFWLISDCLTYITLLGVGSSTTTINPVSTDACKNLILIPECTAVLQYNTTLQTQEAQR